MDKITAENEAKALALKLGEGWYYTIYCTFKGHCTYVVINTNLDIYIRSPHDKFGFRCEFSDGVGEYGDTAIAAMFNLSRTLSATAQLVDNLAHKVK